MEAQGASVKIMLSYDYCHFEICIGTNEAMTNVDIDNMRKDAQRLADKAVAQYKIAKEEFEANGHRVYEYDKAKARVAAIEKKAEGDRTINEIAELKAFNDRDWDNYIRERYDYQDDWETRH